MEYPVIVERKNGVFRALVPALADLSAEAASSDEAVRKVQAAAETYLSEVEFRTIQVQAPAWQNTSRLSTARDWLEAVKVFADDETALREHFAELEIERLRQREEAHREGAQ